VEGQEGPLDHSHGERGERKRTITGKIKIQRRKKEPLFLFPRKPRRKSPFSRQVGEEKKG